MTYVISGPANGTLSGTAPNVTYTPNAGFGGATDSFSYVVYDGQCRLCVTAKKGLERLGTHADATPIRMVPYQSEEAKQALRSSTSTSHQEYLFRKPL